LVAFSITKRRSRSDFGLQFGFGNLSFDSLLLPSSASRFHHAVFCLAIKVMKTGLRIPLVVFVYGSEGKRGVHIGWWVDESSNKAGIGGKGTIGWGSEGFWEEERIDFDLAHSQSLDLQ
jgi:hypothetical protein